MKINVYLLMSGTEFLHSLVGVSRTKLKNRRKTLAKALLIGNILLVQRPRKLMDSIAVPL